MVQQLDSMMKVPFEPWEIGGELLDILSRGLYSDARDAIREYAQNGIDASASHIVVNVAGPQVTIRDDGVGMDWETIRRARRFGLSDKNLRDNVGFRGIGLYSAFGMCESLSITSHPAGAAEEYTIHFEFGTMRRILEQDREGLVRSGVALSDLIVQYSGFQREEYPEGLEDQQFTIVTLSGVDQEYRAQLSNVESLRSYLLATLPIAFPEDEYGTTVNEWLAKHLGIRPVQVSVRVGLESNLRRIQPPVVSYVDKPESAWLSDATESKKLAFVWHAYSPHRYRLGSRFPGDDSGDASGFLLKCKGFTLGDRLALKSLWPPLGGGALYHHFTGEVHILDEAEVYPNAARDGLEPSLAKQQLEQSLRIYFDRLNRRADLDRDLKNAQQKIQDLDETFTTLERRFTNENDDAFELYRLCQNHSEDLDAVERQMLRRTRGRKAIRPNEAQGALLNVLKGKVTTARRLNNGLLRRARAQSGASNRPRTSGTRPRPHDDLLGRAVSALESMVGDKPNEDISLGLQVLRSAANAHSLTRAAGVLDGLKAEQLTISDLVEAARKEIRLSLGWSATGPVSLKEALDDTGFSMETRRERLLVEIIDHGLLSATGGRGPQYEASIRAIADELANDERFQEELVI